MTSCLASWREMVKPNIYISRNGWRGCRKQKITSWSETVTLVLNMLETCFWCKTQGLWEWEIIWNHFHESQFDLEVKNLMKGVLEAKDDFME